MARIVHLSSVHQPFDTRVFRKECVSLAAAGHDVHLVVRHDGDAVVDGVRILGLTASSGRLGRMTGTVASLWRKARELDGDLYHFHDPELIPVGCALRWGGRPVVYDAHENYAAQIRGKPWIAPELRRPLAAVAGTAELGLARAMSAVIAAGADIEARFSGRVKRVVRIENFPILDPILLQPKTAEREEFTIVNFGGVWDARVTGEQISALGLLAEGSPIRMVLGGRIFQADLDRSIRSLPGWGRVEAVGQVDRETMVERMRGASAAAILYADSPNHHSIRSNRVYEAMAAGLPVIVSDLPEWRAFVERHGCGLAVDPAEPRAIATAFERLAADREAATEMGRRGQQAVREIYNWEREAGKLLTLYEELLGARSSREASP